MKIGRNERCYCGSGIKYKRCCLQIDEKLGLLRPIAELTSLVTYKFVDQMSTVEIEQRLKRLGVPFNREEFLEDIKVYVSAEDLAENWFETYSLELNGEDEDFLILAAWVLWDRLGSEEYLSRERLADMYEEGMEFASKQDFVKAAGRMLAVWEGLKRWHRPELQDIRDLHKPFQADFFVSNFCQDLELVLGSAGREDKTYYEKQIAYCTEFCKLFPNSSELIIQNMRYAIADAYFKLGDSVEAEKQYKKTVVQFPQNSWGYMRLGDFYFLDRQGSLEDALQCYERAQQLADDSMDIEMVEERLEDIRAELQKSE